MVRARASEWGSRRISYRVSALSTADRPRPVSLAIIRFVRSHYPEPAATPIQSTRNLHAIGRIEIFTEFRSCLKDLQDFDLAWVIAWLDRATAPAEDGRVVPFMLAGTGRRLGIFATRHPARPNPIGLSVVRVLAVDESGLTFAGVDLCHATPVLDIKPWQQHLDIPGFDGGWEAITRIRGGWYASTGAAEGDQVLPVADVSLSGRQPSDPTS